MKTRQQLMDDMWMQRALKALRDAGISFTIEAEFKERSDQAWQYDRSLRFRQH